MLDVRLDHDPQRRVLQVRELREHVGVRLETVLVPQQRSYNPAPFRLERIACLGPPCSVVPVAGVADVSFLPVKIGMHPRAALIVGILRH